MMGLIKGPDCGEFGSGHDSNLLHIPKFGQFRDMPDRIFLHRKKVTALFIIQAFDIEKPAKPEALSKKISSTNKDFLIALPKNNVANDRF